MTLADELAAASTVDDARRGKITHPSGWDPGCEDNGYTGHIVTQPSLTPIKSYEDVLRFNGLDPDGVEVVEPVQSRAWDVTVGGETSRYYYHRINWRRKRPGLDVDGLLADIRKWRVKAPEKVTGGVSFVVAMGDLQLGKVDGDGVEGTVDRVRAGINESVARLKELRKKTPVEAVYLVWLGDCIEGFTSQGGTLQWRVGLTLTEQVRILRRLMLAQIKAFAPLAQRVVVVSIPGNHDEAVRNGGKMSTRYDDSWAVEAAVSVGDLLQENPEAFGHVRVWTPKRDELTVTLNVSGTICGFAHGHQFGKDPEKWWANQAHGMQAIGEATILFGAHKHHLRVIQSGFKTFMQTPALDGGSTWWRHQTGQDSPPGLLTALVGGGSWSDLAVL